MRIRVMLCTACALAVSAPSAQAAFPGENGRIAVMADRDDDGVDELDIWTFGPNGQNPRNLTADSVADDVVPKWSPDGHWLAFASNRTSRTNRGGDFELYVMRADGSGLRQLTFNQVPDFTGGWSPDGERIVFDREFAPFDVDVFTIQTNGWGERNLTRSPGIMDRQPAWSPDGREIAFSHGGKPDGSEFGDLYTMRPDGSHRRQLTATDTDEESPAWSPDGRVIAFNSDASHDWELWAIRASGGSPWNLTNAPDSGDGGGAWSPDGRKLLFGSDRGGGHDLFKMRADGSHQRNITRDAAFETAPDWQPLADRRDREADED
jgi:Tol biopolymer transport system component